MSEDNTSKEQMITCKTKGCTRYATTREGYCWHCDDEEVRGKLSAIDRKLFGALVALVVVVFAVLALAAVCVTGITGGH